MQPNEFNTNAEKLAAKREPAATTNEVPAEWENACPVPFEGLHHFKILLEYNDTVMAACDDRQHGRGFHYATWKYDYNRAGFHSGHYTDDYDSARESFAIRSGLVSREKIFTQEQATEIKSAIEFCLDYDSDFRLTDSSENTLKKVVEKINYAYAGMEREYDLGYGHLGNGITVWNRAEKHNGDYVTVAHIRADRSVRFYDENMPDELKADIERIARTSDIRVSTTQQDRRVFDTPPTAETPAAAKSPDCYSQVVNSSKDERQRSPKSKPTLQEKMENAKKKVTQEDAARKDSRGGKPKKYERE